MAKVVVAYAGEEPRTVWEDLPLNDALRILEPDRRRLSDASHPPRIGSSDLLEPWIAGYQEVLMLVDPDEVKSPWKSGYYRSPLTPAEAFFRLQVHKRLGQRWRDEWSKGEDADGDPAIWLWAVLKSSAPTSEWARGNRERIHADVRKAAAESRISDWVFVRFRKEKEETAVS